MKYPINPYKTLQQQFEKQKMSREELIFKAKILEQIDRYDEMIQVIKEIVALGQQLTFESRKLLQIAYRKCIISLRTSSRILKSIQKKEETKDPESKKLIFIKKYDNKIDLEVFKFANDLIELIDKSILPRIKSDEQSIFFLKLKADYYRYLMECTSGEVKKGYAKQAGEAYEEAFTKALRGLKRSNTLRIGLALNYSVYCYDVLEDTKKAIEIAKDSFEDARAGVVFEPIEESQMKETALIMRMLDDNVTQWTSEIKKAA